MEEKTLEDVIQRLDRLEKMVKEVNAKLSCIAEELTPDTAKDYEAAAIRGAAALQNNKQDAHIAKEALARVYKRMGISPDFELRPLEEVRRSMVESGIRPEDNEFSRAIIAEREK